MTDYPLIEIEYKKALDKALKKNGEFLNNPSPSVNELTSQIKTLTRQINAMIRITNGLLEDNADSKE